MVELQRFIEPVNCVQQVFKDVVGVLVSQNLLALIVDRYFTSVWLLSAPVNGMINTARAMGSAR